MKKAAGCCHVGDNIWVVCANLEDLGGTGNISEPAAGVELHNLIFPRSIDIEILSMPQRLRQILKVTKFIRK